MNIPDLPPLLVSPSSSSHVSSDADKYNGQIFPDLGLFLQPCPKLDQTKFIGGQSVLYQWPLQSTLKPSLKEYPLS